MGTPPVPPTLPNMPSDPNPLSSRKYIQWIGGGFWAAFLGELAWTSSSAHPHLSQLLSDGVLLVLAVSFTGHELLVAWEQSLQFLRRLRAKRPWNTAKQKRGRHRKTRK